MKHYTPYIDDEYTNEELNRLSLERSMSGCLRATYFTNNQRAHKVIFR